MRLFLFAAWMLAFIPSQGAEVYEEAQVYHKGVCHYLDLIVQKWDEMGYKTPKDGEPWTDYIAGTEDPVYWDLVQFENKDKKSKKAEQDVAVFVIAGNIMGKLGVIAGLPRNTKSLEGAFFIAAEDVRVFIHPKLLKDDSKPITAAETFNF